MSSISIILSLLHSEMNYEEIWNKSGHLLLNLLWHCLVIFMNYYYYY